MDLIGLFLGGKGAVKQDRLGKGAVYRAFIGNLQQALPLFIGQLAFKDDIAMDAVTCRAVDFNFFVAERDADLGKREALALGVHAQGHRGAGTESGHQEIERGRAGIGAPHADRFIGKQLMLADGHALLVSSLSIFCDDYDSRHVSLLE